MSSYAIARKNPFLRYVFLYQIMPKYNTSNFSVCNIVSHSTPCYAELLILIRKHYASPTESRGGDA